MEGFIRIPILTELPNYIIPQSPTPMHSMSSSYSASTYSKNSSSLSANTNTNTNNSSNSTNSKVTSNSNDSSNGTNNNTNNILNVISSGNLSINGSSPLNGNGNEYITRGAWSVNEDTLLRNAVLHFGLNHWDSVASTIPGRTPTQCRERWLFRISPGLKKSPFESWEDEFIISERKRIGNHWTQIAAQLPGRTSCAVKNRWYTVLRKHIKKDDSTTSSSNNNNNLLQHISSNSNSSSSSSLKMANESFNCAIAAIEIKNLLSQPVGLHSANTI